MNFVAIPTGALSKRTSEMYSAVRAEERMNDAPPTSAPTHVVIMLRNGGWAGDGHKQYYEDCHAMVASRVEELVPQLVLSDAGITLQCGHQMAIIQRETATFSFITRWCDQRFENAFADSSVVKYADDGAQIKEWTLNVSAAFANTVQSDFKMKQLLARTELLRAEKEESENNEAAKQQLPPPPVGLSARQFMAQRESRESYEGVPMTPITSVGVY